MVRERGRYNFAHVSVLDRDGNEKRRISLPKDTSLTECGLAIHTSGLIFVSYTIPYGGTASKVKCFTEEGGKNRVVCRYTFSDPELEGATGIHVCDDASVLVCYQNSDKVTMINNDGSKGPDILTGLNNPCGVSFREADRTLVVTMKDSDEMLVCKLEYDL